MAYSGSLVDEDVGEEVGEEEEEAEVELEKGAFEGVGPACELQHSGDGDCDWGDAEDVDPLVDWVVVVAAVGDKEIFEFW